MNIKLILFSLLCLPMLGMAQQKKSTKKLDEQVKAAKAQEAAAEHTSQPTQSNLPLALPGAPLLPFTLVTSDEIRITKEDITEGKPVLFVLFNPQCDHCQKVASEIKSNMSKFKHVTIIFTTGMNLLGELKNFIAATGLEGMPNVKVCAGPEEFASQIFERKGIPQMMSYNKDWILQKTFYETINIDSTLMYLNK